jgi:uncharacterized protein (TIGR03083 family)
MVSPMDTELYMTTIRRDADAMADAARAAGLDADVPTCPGWTVRDLMVHTGRVHRHKAEVVRGRYVESDAAFPPRPDGDVLEWFVEGVDEMLNVFEAADLSEPSWTWCPHDHNADWWVRRMAHETAIHGADALIAAGRMPIIDASLAADGVDEILDEFMVDIPEWGTAKPGDKTVALEAGGRRWGLRMGTLSGIGPKSGTAHEGLLRVLIDDVVDPDAVVRTDPETLDLWLWGRGELPDEATTGDRSVVDHVRAVAVEATQ